MSIGYSSTISPEVPDAQPCGYCGHAVEEHSEILGCAWSSGGKPIECDCTEYLFPDPPEENGAGEFDTLEEKDLA